MLIEDHTYKLHWTGRVIIRDDGTPREMQVPVSEDNWAYQEFLRWDAVPGNDPVPADPKPPVPAQDIADSTALDAFRAGWMLGQARLGSVAANSIQRQMNTVESDMDGVAAATIGNLSGAATLIKQEAADLKIVAEAVKDMANQLQAVKRVVAIQGNVTDR